MNEDSSKRQFGRDILGPVFLAYCHRLWLFQLGIGSTPAIALFASRGGLRLLALYRRFLSAQATPPPIDCQPFMISRLAAAKASYLRAPKAVAFQIVRAFRGQTIATLAAALAPKESELALAAALGELPAALTQAPVTEASFADLLSLPGAFGKSLHRHFEEQGELFGEYLHDMARDRSRILLCDTGLYGSTQAMVAAAYPEYEWTGLYFAKANYSGDRAPHHAEAFGLIFDRDHPSLFQPASALLRYWHLCEMPMEPPLPSVFYFHREPGGKVESNLGNRAVWQAAVDRQDNPFFQGICDHFDGSSRPRSATEINREFDLAARRLQKRIYMPSTSDVQAMTVAKRYPDFGREGEVSVVVDVAPTTTLATRVALVGQSLWQEGQTRLAFPILGAPANRVRWGLHFLADTARLLPAALGR